MILLYCKSNIFLRKQMDINSELVFDHGEKWLIKPPSRKIVGVSLPIIVNFYCPSLNHRLAMLKSKAALGLANSNTILLIITRHYSTSEARQYQITKMVEETLYESLSSLVLFAGYCACHKWLSFISSILITPPCPCPIHISCLLGSKRALLLDS